jgi:adenylylsulfate kinase-like enzyme
VIKAIVAWADSTLLWNTHVLWLYGFVGCGKSAIALAIALKFERRNRLVGSFFFFRNTATEAG